MSDEISDILKGFLASQASDKEVADTREKELVSTAARLRKSLQTGVFPALQTSIGKVRSEGFRATHICNEPRSIYGEDSFPGDFTTCLEVAVLSPDRQHGGKITFRVDPANQAIVCEFYVNGRKGPENSGIISDADFTADDIEDLFKRFLSTVFSKK